MYLLIYLLLNFQFLSILDNNYSPLIYAVIDRQDTDLFPITPRDSTALFFFLYFNYKRKSML